MAITLDNQAAKVVIKRPRRDDTEQVVSVEINKRLIPEGADIIRLTLDMMGKHYSLQPNYYANHVGDRVKFPRETLGTMNVIVTLGYLLNGIRHIKRFYITCTDGRTGSTRTETYPAYRTKGINTHQDKRVIPTYLGDLTIRRTDVGVVLTVPDAVRLACDDGIASTVTDNPVKSMVTVRADNPTAKSIHDIMATDYVMTLTEGDTVETLYGVSLMKPIPNVAPLNKLMGDIITRDIKVTDEVREALKVIRTALVG